ncbi:MAG: hypothetical protein SCJ93_09440 [Bacillota bacterium]|nr:hypothetical protein [Bacillota bacterium]
MDNLQGNIIANLDKLSEGNLDTDISIVDEDDEIGPALKKTRDSLKSLTEETYMLKEMVFREYSSISLN